jgi:hypothetical protein
VPGTVSAPKPFLTAARLPAADVYSWVPAEVRNRTFRRTPLCHDHGPLRRPPRGEAVTALYLTGLVRPAAGQGGKWAWWSKAPNVARLRVI